MEEKKKTLLEKTKVALKEKLSSIQTDTEVDFSTMDKDRVDGFKIIYPSERYDAYQAHTSVTLDFKKDAHVNNVRKSSTYYYEPLLEDGFDVVINPVIAAPAIQVVYEVKMRLTPPPKVEKKVEVKEVVKYEYMFITPTGEVKKIPLEK